jgi:hypothetical protein
MDSPEYALSGRDVGVAANFRKKTDQFLENLSGSPASPAFLSRSKHLGGFAHTGDRARQNAPRVFSIHSRRDLAARFEFDNP